MCMFGRVRHRVPHDVLRILPQCGKEIKLLVTDNGRFFFIDHIRFVLFIKHASSYYGFCQ